MDMNTYVVANPHRCISCRACEIACAVAHLSTTVVVAGQTDTPFQPRLNLVQTPLVGAPVQCHQCENAPCATICPVGAITRQDDTNVVNTDKCIGCKSCLVACPFGAINLVPHIGQQEKLIAHKCDICCGRKEGPACAESCPASAFVVVKPTELREKVKSKRAEAVALALQAQQAQQALAQQQS